MSEEEPKYAFYEKIIVDSRDKKKDRVNGQTGAVLGRDKADDGTWYYTVYIYATRSSWCFFENELLPTGEHANRSDFYDGTSIRVGVDEEGKGGIIREPHGQDG